MTAQNSAVTSAVTSMARRLTTPFARGADTLPLKLSLGDRLATVDSYDFAEHIAAFGRLPEPRYALATTRDLDVATTVTVTFEDSGADPLLMRTAVPAGTLAGQSFVLDLPVSATGRVTVLNADPIPADGRPDLAWTLTALLGNMAKLLWVVGGERDAVRGHAARTLEQRHLPTAVGLSLDLIGTDLGVPRFPPLPYGFDQDTVALYHLDDTAAPIADLTAAYPGRIGHPGILVGQPLLGVAGRYGQAVAFRAAGSSIDIASATAFDIAVGASATVECFVLADLDTAEGPVLSRRTGTAGSGWVLAVGDFGRGIPRNVRFTISDGIRPVELFADTSLPTDAFTHLAGVLDRDTGRVALFVNGVLRATLPIGGLGAIVSTAPLRIGTGAGGFRGAIDEVRISSVARASFAPALGEQDEHYRRRLRVFRRWSLPTPSNLTAMLNELVGPIGGTKEALIVDDTNATLVRGTRLVRIRPVTLRPGESINAAGRRRMSEAESVGSAEFEDSFDPAFLLRYDRPEVDFTLAPVRDLQPGEPPPDPHLVQAGVAQRLDRLVALAGAETSPPGRLLVDTAFDPRAADLRATGRAVMLGHSSVPPGRLAALAHRAGFDFVRYRGAGTAQVYAAAALGDYFTIQLDPAPAGLSDVDTGGTVALSLQPQPPLDAFVRWLVVPGGKGRGTLTPDGAPGTRQATATLRATAAGQLIVKADVTRGRHTVPATRRLKVGLTDLADNHSVTADGTLDAPSTVVDVPDAFFHSAFLIRHDDPRVDYGTVEDHRRMQPAVGEVLDSLLAELTRRGVAGKPVVTAAFDAAGDTAAQQGRRLVLRHPNLTPGALAGIAFAAGFGHVEHKGADVLARQRPGQLVVVRGPSGVDTGPIIEVDEGSSLEVTAAPAPAVLLAAGLTGPPPANEPRLAWASGTFDEATIALGSSTQQVNRLNAGDAGVAWIQASYLLGPALPPFTFQVRLRPELDTPATVISKDQFDLIMNILNALHPVGVEVFTSAIREHVIEVRGDLLQANPDYTYPKFRVRGALPRSLRGGQASG